MDIIMPIFPNIRMPSEFCEILQKDMDRQWVRMNDQNESLFGSIISSESFMSLIEIHFAHLYPSGKVQHYLRSLGWKNFRDRLASIYLHHAKTNQFPGNTSLETLEEILMLENDLKNLSSSGSSRTFLLLFYLEFLQIKLKKEGQLKQVYEQYSIPPKLVTFIAGIKQKLYETDYFILMVWHLYNYFGESILKELKEKKEKHLFSYYLDKMNPHQKNIFIENMLSYSSSIEDYQVFLKKI